MQASAEGDPENGVAGRESESRTQNQDHPDEMKKET